MSPSATPTLAGPSILLNETGESDSGLWQSSGSWSRSNIETAHSGSWLFSDSPGTTYTAGTIAGLNLVHPLHLPLNTRIQLQYWQRLDLAEGDSVQVHISTDNSAWVTVATETAVRNLAWTVRTIDLSAYAGQSLWLRFVLTVDQEPTTVGEGWWLDDITVWAEPLPVTPRSSLTVQDSDDMTLWLAEGNWQLVGTPIHSESLAWTTTLVPNTATALTLNVDVNLAGMTAPELRFWHMLDLAPDGDIAQVQLSVDDGQTWLSLELFTATNNATTWNEQMISLDAYAGHLVRIRFLLVAGHVEPHGAGWTVDTITLQSRTGQPPLPTPDPATSTPPSSTPTLTSTPENIGWNTYADTDPLLQYSAGQWQTFQVSEAEGGTLTASANLDATLTLYFVGTDIRIVFAKGPEGGSFTAIVDSVTQQIADGLDASYSYGHVLAFEGLSDSEHSLTVTNGDGAIWIEAVQVQGQLIAQLTPPITPTPSPTATATEDEWNTYQDTDPLLVYGSGEWETFEVAAANGGTLTTSADAGAMLTASFEGTGIRVVYSKGPEGRTFAGQVDGGAVQTADGYADTYSYGYVLAFEDLAEGPHTLTVTNGAGAIWVEAVQVHGSLLMQEQMPLGILSIVAPDSGFYLGDQAKNLQFSSNPTPQFYYESIVWPDVDRESAPIVGVCFDATFVGANSGFAEMGSDHDGYGDPGVSFFPDSSPIGEGFYPTCIANNFSHPDGTSFYWWEDICTQICPNATRKLWSPYTFPKSPADGNYVATWKIEYGTQGTLSISNMQLIYLKQPACKVRVQEIPNKVIYKYGYPTAILARADIFGGIIEADAAQVFSEGDILTLNQRYVHYGYEKDVYRVSHLNDEPLAQPVWVATNSNVELVEGNCETLPSTDKESSSDFEEHIELIRDYGVDIRSDGLQWTQAELEQILTIPVGNPDPSQNPEQWNGALGRIGQAFSLIGANGNNAREQFRTVLVSGDVPEYILLVRLASAEPHGSLYSDYYDANHPNYVKPGGCITNQGWNPPDGEEPRRILCRGAVQVTQYTVTHEIGHIFDNRSTSVTRLRERVARNLDDYRAHPSDNNKILRNCGFDLNAQKNYTVIPPAQTPPYGAPIMGNTLGDEEQWGRGDRGWGSLRGTCENPTPFQQHPEGCDSTELPEDEAAADMFLNWVYRRTSDPVEPTSEPSQACYPPGYETWTITEWNNHVQSDWEGFRNIDAFGDPDYNLPGNRRYWWMEAQMNEILTEKKWKPEAQS